MKRLSELLLKAFCLALDTYSHVLTEMQQGAVNVVEDLLKMTTSSRSAGIKEGMQTATLEHIKIRVDEVWSGQKSINARLEEHDRRIRTLEDCAPKRRTTKEA